MRCFECTCLTCGSKKQIQFYAEPYPEYGEKFFGVCPVCKVETQMTRALTKKVAAELRKRQEEADLHQSIIQRCEFYGFQYRFLYQSVIVTTPLSNWCFDYHQSRKTLYHESTVKVNFETGNYAKSHVQFRNRKMSSLEVIDYIADHDKWRQSQLLDSEIRG